MRFFFVPDINDAVVVLDEDSSKHITQVLRMKAGDSLMLTDGKGTGATAIIEDDHRKRCTVRVLEKTVSAQTEPKIAIAISMVKNASRFEWFLEKATEIGVSEIIPIICTRTEKEKFRYDRLQGIITSALLQSQQSWMPVLHEPIPFNQLISTQTNSNKFIAHCLPNEKTNLATVAGNESTIILIGPEGDFTPDEIQSALEQGYRPVALGNTRLRTETAGLVAATILRIGYTKQ